MINLRKSVVITILILVVGSALAGCELSSNTPDANTPSPAIANETVSALQTENAGLSTQVAGLEDAIRSTPSPAPTEPPTSTPTPTLTPTPAPTIAVPEGVLTATHELAPGYVFVVDPEIWEIENSSAQDLGFLSNQQIADCRIDIASETAPGELLQYFPAIIGRRGWLVEGYEEVAYYIHLDLRLEIPNTENEDCRLSRSEVLERMLSEAEFNGEPGSTPAVPPTPRPTVDGFTCEGALPHRLQVGDRVLVTAGFLWLRETASLDEGNEIRLFQQYAPAEITVIGGPTCVDGFIFWEVVAVEFGEAGEAFPGWMAESSAEEYFLEPWYLGW